MALTGLALGERIWFILTAPFENTEMLWLVIPLVLALIVFEFYFGGHRKEELGWNSAVANSMLLIFVSIALLRIVFPDTSPIDVFNILRDGIVNKTLLQGASMSLLIVMFIMAEGIFLFFTNFFHMWPKTIAFAISSTLPINLTAYLATVLVFSHQGTNPLPLDFMTFFAAFVLLLVLTILFGVVHLVERIFT